MTRLPEDQTAACAGRENTPTGLDWQAFSAVYFPGRRRHDLEAITAYGSYKRLRVADEPWAQNAAPGEEPNGTPPRSAAEDDWEDKAARHATTPGVGEGMLP
jgi:hypothetical protein